MHYSYNFIKCVGEIVAKRLNMWKYLLQLFECQYLES